MVVKAVRPGIESTIRKDIALLYTVAKLVLKYNEDGQRLHPVEVVKDYETVILEELNLQSEGANASLLRHNFSESCLLHVPEIHWPYSNKDVLVMERIYGVQVSDMAALREQGTDFKLLAERGVEVFFTQVFRDSFFHADMHPGNIFVSKYAPENPQYIAIDFGIVGTLNRDDKRYLAENFIAFFNPWHFRFIYIEKNPYF